MTIKQFHVTGYKSDWVDDINDWMTRVTDDESHVLQNPERISMRDLVLIVLAIRDSEKKGGEAN